MGNKYFKPKRLTVGQQVFGMKASYPHFCCMWRQGAATWTGPVQPSAMSEEYQIKVVYRLGNTPQVSILFPQLRGRPDHPAIPHVYSGNHPCLYLPRADEWNPGKSIAETIIPWTSLWLYYYEV
jgi:hypothetical protein